MTVSGIITGIVITAVMILMGIFILGDDMEPRGKILGVSIIIAVIAGTWFGLVWYFNNTASGARDLKTQQSNFNNGINRVITLYDIEGDVIQQYEGKFDIDYSDERILFDDEQGNRHIIYFKTGTVIVTEVMNNEDT